MRISAVGRDRGPKNEGGRPREAARSEGEVRRERTDLLHGDVVEFLAWRTTPSEAIHAPVAKTFPDDLLERITQRRERLFREHGNFDTLTILRELRENGPR